MRVLGIETSCDDTGIAIYDGDNGLLANILHTQAVHAQYGGIVPELASRDHIRTVLPLIEEALATAKLKLNEIDAIAYTAGPGLFVTLLIGASVARSLGWGLNIPTLGVHHMEAHLLACQLEETYPEFPFLALLVSGGHTMLVKVTQLGVYEILGETLDDAAGEAFDKVAKLLGLGYPGGPALAKLATQGNPERFHFPRPMLDRPGLDFSFSGLKTFAMNTLQKYGEEPQIRADVARAFEDAVVATLARKAKRAMNDTGISSLVIAGGVGANQALRQHLQQMVKEIGGAVYYPRPEFCTDNGAMVAYAGYLRLKQGNAPDALTVQVKPRWAIDELVL